MHVGDQALKSGSAQLHQGGGPGLRLDRHAVALALVLSASDHRSLKATSSDLRTGSVR